MSARLTRQLISSGLQQCLLLAASPWLLEQTQRPLSSIETASFGGLPGDFGRQPHLRRWFCKVGNAHPSDTVQSGHRWSTSLGWVKHRVLRQALVPNVQLLRPSSSLSAFRTFILHGMLW